MSVYAILPLRFSPRCFSFAMPLPRTTIVFADVTPLFRHFHAAATADIELRPPLRCFRCYAMIFSLLLIRYVAVIPLFFFRHAAISPSLPPAQAMIIEDIRALAMLRCAALGLFRYTRMMRY